MSDKIKRDSWSTPQWLFDKLNEEFDFQLDIAASDLNHKCEKYLTMDDDALNVDCDSIIEEGYIWCNPPYSKVGPWVEKAKENKDKGLGSVLLLKNDCSTKWFTD